MEKISRILPNSPRVTAADLQSGGAARPGGPAFGRPLGVSTNQRTGFDGAERATLAHQELTERRTDDQKRADAISHLADNFFMKKIKEEKIAEELSNAARESFSGPTPDEIELLASNLKASQPAETEEEMDQPSVGRYLDVVA